jgi:Ca2+-binding RTX toxin-like protein
MVSSVLAAGLTTVYQQLTAFAGLESFWTNFDSIFGTEYKLAVAQSLRSQWQNGNFSQLPTIEVIDDQILGKARGAYASSTNVIYLSDQFVKTASSQTLEAVILEEIGHFVDAQVNSVDSAGDEGAIFAALVQGQHLDAATLQVLKAEDDSATITLNGQLITVEQSTDPGNTRATAYDFGALTYNLTPPLGVPVLKQYVDTVGGTDSDDYFKFTLDKTLGIGISASFSANTTLELLDANGVLITSRNDNYQPSIGQNLDAGTYYLHLSTGNTTVSNYTVNLVVGPLDNAGNDIQSAKDLGTLGNTLISQSDYFFQQAAQLGGYPDYVDFDYYQFTLSETRKVTFKTSSSPNSSTSFSLSQKAGNAPYFYESQLGYLYNDSQSGEPSIALDQILGAGTYYILILGSGVYDSYDSRKPLPVSYVLELSSSAAPSDPGNTKETAYSLGSLNYNLVLPSAPPLFVAYSNTIQAGSDPDDYYKFTIDKTLGIVLDWSTAGGTDYPNPPSTTKVEILREDGSLVTTQNSPSYSGLGLNLDAGTYYLRFNTNSSVNVNYNFTLGSGPLDNAGNDEAHAKNLGVLGNTPITQSDYVFQSGYKTGGFIVSELDYYQFSLSQTSQVTFNLTINGSAFGYANLYLFRNSIYYGYANEITPLVKTLDAGTYFLKIDGNGAYDSTTSSYAPASYNLSLSTGTTTSPTITLATAPASVLEDGTANLVYTFTRTGDLTNTLSVNYSIAGTADSSDYTGATPGTGKTITFAANSATATLTIDPTADTTIEANDTVALTLATGTGYTIGTTAAVTGTITNDDNGGTTNTFSNVSAITINDGTSSTPYPSNINVSGLSGNLSSLKVTLSNLSHTYSDDIDVLLVGPTGAKAILMSDVGGSFDLTNITLTFDPTASSSLPDDSQISSGIYKPTDFVIGDFFNPSAPVGPYGTDVSVFNNTNPNGTWSLYIMDDLGGDVGNIAGGWSLTIGITATAPSITLAVAPPSVTEDGTTNLVYTFTRTGATTSALTVNYGITGTADATDYTGATPGTGKTITFAANSATATLTINPTADTAIEANETVVLTLATGAGYTIGTSSTVTGNITNDDLPSINLSPNGQTVVEGLTSPQNLSYTVSLSSSSPQTITVQYSTANGTALAGSDYTTTTGTLTFNPGVTSQTISIPILNDSVNEANETFTLKLTSPTNAILGGTATVTTTITDTLSASTTTTLAANVENLTLTGSSVINGTGNTGNNVLTGNSANNTLNGGDGNDTLNGGAGNDTLNGGNGNDFAYYYSSTGSVTVNLATGIASDGLGGTDTLSQIENVQGSNTAGDNLTGNTGNNVLYGYGGNDILNGGDGNDTLNGGTGNDTLIGGLGNDVYQVDSTTDVITENSGQGTDTIQSSVTYMIASLANIENLTLTGSSVIDGTGNTVNNSLTGNTANNTLNGGDGNDTLNGGAGNDSLIGGNGNDFAYYYSSTASVTVNLTTGTASDGLGGTDTLSFIENVQGSNTAGDNLTGNTGVNVLYGYGGADILTGGLGNDSLYLGSDTVTDTVNYTSGDGADTVYNFVRGVGGDILKFTGITAIDVQVSGSNTLFKVGDGISGNTGFGSGTLLLTTSATTGFTATDIGVNLFNVTNSAGFFFS